MKPPEVLHISDFHDIPYIKKFNELKERIAFLEGRIASLELMLDKGDYTEQQYQAELREANGL